jgi:hypothetical protein
VHDDHRATREHARAGVPINDLAATVAGGVRLQGAMGSQSRRSGGNRKGWSRSPPRKL